MMENIERPEHQTCTAGMAAHVIIQRTDGLVDIAPGQYPAGIDNLRK